MSKNNYRLLIILVLVVLSFAGKEKTLNLDEVTNDSVNEKENVIFYTITYGNAWGDNQYLAVKTETEQVGNFAEIYMSENDEKPSRRKYTLLATDIGENLLYIPKKTIINSNNFYLGIYCSTGEDFGCNYKITFSFSNFMTIDQGSWHSFISVDNFSYTIHITRSEIDANGVLSIFATGGATDQISMNGYYITTSEENQLKPNDITVSSNFLLNGDISTFDLKDYTYTQDAYFEIFVTAKKGIYITVGSRLISKPTHVIAGHKAIQGYFETSIIKMECLNLDQVIPSGQKAIYNINVASRTQNAELFFKYENSDKETPIKTFTSPGFATIDESEELDKLICIRPMEGTNKVSYEIQITNWSVYNGSVSTNEPKINGYVYTLQWQSNQIQYYRRTKFTQKDTTNFNMQTISGNPIMYVHKCETFPNCIYNDQTLPEFAAKNELYISHRVGDFSTITVPSLDETDEMSAIQNVLIVQCGNTEDCVFEISFMDSDDTLVLNPGKSYSQFLLESQNDQFTFEIVEKNINLIVISLYTYSGDSYMQFISNPKGVIFAQEYDVANKEIIIIENENELLGSYTFIITAQTNTFYSVSLDTFTTSLENTVYNVRSGVLVLETIRKQDGIKKIQLDHSRGIGSTPFFATFFSLNCKIDVIFGGETLTQINNLTQHLISTSEINEPYTLKIISYDHDLPNDDYICMVYVLTNEVPEGRELVIAEATPVKVSWKKEWKLIRYLLPLPVLTGDVIINVVWESEYSLNLTYEIENTKFPLQSFSRSRQFIIKEEKITQACKNSNQVCNVIIEIAAPDSIETDIPIQILVKSKQLIPSYLKKKELRQDVMITNSVQYYLSDISHNEEGEVVWNFNRGSGKLLVRIVSKEVREEGATYNGRVILPTSESKDLLTFDPFTKTVNYTKAETSICEKGCEIYISVVSDDKYIFDQVWHYINDFSIMIRTTNNRDAENRVVNIPVNKYVSSALFDTITNNYYCLYIPNETHKIIIEFQSEICDWYVNEGDTIPNNNNADWKFKSVGKNTIFTILKEHTDKTWKNRVFTFAVTSTQLDSIYSARYSMRISTPNTKAFNLIEINSDQSTLCPIEKAGDYCYYILPINLYDEFNNLLVYAFGEKFTDITIYAIGMDMSFFDKLTDEKKQDLFPKKNNSSYSSESQLNTDHLSINLKEIRENNYIWISVHSTVKTMITLLTNWRTNLESWTPNSSTLQWFNVPNEKTITFNIPSNNKYILHVTSVEGSGIINFKGEDQYALRGSRDSMSLTVTKKEKQLNVSSKLDDNFKFFFWYTIRPENENFDEIEYGTTGDLLYEQSDFPIIYYTKIWDENEDINMYINFKTLITTDKEKATTNHNFTITGIITDEELIIDKMGNSSRNPDLTINSLKGVYDYGMKTGKVFFKSSYIKEYTSSFPKYLYVVIEKSSGNTNVYSSIHAEITVLPKSDTVYYSPISLYNQGNLILNQTTANLHRLRLENKKDKIKWEFAGNSGSINYAILDYSSNPTDWYTNSTNIQIDRFENKNGKSVLILSQINKEIILSIFSTNQDHKVTNEALTNYVFKYQSGTVFAERTIEKSEPESKYNTNDLSLTITIDPIITKANDSNDVVDAVYYLKIVANDKLEETELLNTINIFPKDVYAVYEEKVNENKKVVFNISKFPIDTIYSVSITAITTEDMELFTYDTINNPTNKKDPGSDDETKGKWPLWIISIVIIIVLILVFGLFFVYQQMKKDNQNWQSQVEQVSFVKGNKDQPSEPLIMNEEVNPI